MKLVLIFLALCINIYGNLVTTNGRISLYFDEDEMRIHTVSGDAFHRPDISYIDMAVLIDNKPYFLKDYTNRSRMVPNTNILMLSSEVEGMKVYTFIFPSVVDRDKLYIGTVVNSSREKREIKVVYRLSPYTNINILNYSSPRDYYSLDDVRIKSLNNPMGMYISDEEIMEGLKFKEIRDKTIRYQDDKIILASDVRSERRGSDILIFNFGEGVWENRLELNPGILRDEYNYWKEWNWDFQEYPGTIREQLTQLRMISMGTPIPSNISYNESEESLTTNMKLSSLLSIYGKEAEAYNILRNYRFSRKNTSEDVVVLASLVKSWEASKDIVGEPYIRTTIYPVFQRILEGIDDEGRFLIEEDSLETYYYLIMILEEVLENQNELEYIPVERVREKLALVRRNVEMNYMTPDGLKDSPTSLEANPRNVEYINLYPKGVREELLMSEYRKYYDKKLGFLIFPGDDFVDADYNLTFARHLYNNSFEREGERIFARMKELIKDNNNYITPRMYPHEENEAGIYGDLIFSYLITNYFRGIE